jgi:AcrR family transcriptional regulator
MAKAEETRRRIVDAAEEVVLRDGVARLTLDAAAAEAGLSKGGVLYHFASRDALVAGMVDRIIVEFDRDLDAANEDPGTPGSFTRAYLRATLAPGGPERSREDRLGAALIAAVAAEPQLMAPLRRAFDGWQARIEADGIDPARATALRLAADGLWLSELFGLAAPTGRLRRQLADEVMRLAATP